jgi:FkbM family methyltransferase
MGIGRLVRRVVSSALDRLGYELQRKPVADASVGFNRRYLVRICQPETVIDVGVGYGTYPLYEAFPRAKIILVEPLRDYAAAMEKISRTYDCDIVYKAAGDKAGMQEIQVYANDLQKSSLTNRTALTSSGDEMQVRVIEVVTLDSIFAGAGWRQPILLKVDAEGHELKALQGAEALLAVTEVVIAEVSIAKRFEGSYEFEDMIAFMREHGFAVYSILKVTHVKGEIRPRFADVVFSRVGRAPPPASSGSSSGGQAAT